MDPPLPEARLDDLRLAVTEACSNAIKAHRPDADGEAVEIVCRITEERFRVDIRDHGPGFDPDALDSLPDATHPDRLQHESGLGIPLIRVLTDHVEFESLPDGTRVSMSLDRGAHTSGPSADG